MPSGNTPDESITQTYKHVKLFVYSTTFVCPVSARRRARFHAPAWECDVASYGSMYKKHNTRDL